MLGQIQKIKNGLWFLISQPIEIVGAEGQNRTADTGIFSLFERFLQYFMMFFNVAFVFILSAV